MDFLTVLFLILLFVALLIFIGGRSAGQPRRHTFRFGPGPVRPRRPPMPPHGMRPRDQGPMPHSGRMSGMYRGTRPSGITGPARFPGGGRPHGGPGTSARVPGGGRPHGRPGAGPGGGRRHG